MKPHKTCAELERDVRAEVNRIVQKHVREESDYVRKTNNGMINAPQLLD